MDTNRSLYGRNLANLLCEVDLFPVSITETNNFQGIENLYDDIQLGDKMLKS